MMKRCSQFVVLVTLVVFLSGCPGASTLGVWILTFDGDPTLFGLDFQANGTVTAVDVGSNANLAGTMTWVRISDSEILIRQEVSGELWVFYGRLGSATTMSGGQQKIVGTGSGSGNLWSATKT